MPFFTKQTLVRKLEELGYSPSKSFGQNYLIDPTIPKRFVEDAHLDPTKDIVLEIGPGLGSVTDYILEGAKQCISIEQDKRCARFLEEHYKAKYPTKRFTQGAFCQLKSIPTEFKFIIVEGDAMVVPFPKATKLISSVPYSICYELMLKIIQNWTYESVHLILQKEFVDHVIATEGTPGYTVMAAFAGMYTKGERVFDIPNDAFFPEPDVQSLVSHYYPKSTLDPNTLERKDMVKYLAFLRGIFAFESTFKLQRAVKEWQERKNSTAIQFQHLSSMIKKSPYANEQIRMLSTQILFDCMQKSLHYQK